MSMNFGMGYNPLLNPNITPQQRVMQYEHQMQLQNQMLILCKNFKNKIRNILKK